MGTEGADSVKAGGGNDTIYGFGGNDTIQGDGDLDVIYGGTGNDSIAGNAEADRLYGGSGDDVITGNAAADQIFGGSGNDAIDGGSENDTITGGWGADTLTGGAGDDVFRYVSTKDTGDTVTDFSQSGSNGADKIDFSAIRALTFVNSPTTTLSAYSVIWFRQGNNVVVQVDTDGNVNTAELQITLVGAPNQTLTLTAGDFVLTPTGP